MFDRVVARVVAAVRRVRRVERRELREFHRWVQTTSNLVHLSIIAFVPLLIAAVTTISNSASQLSFLLFPPLASGTYTLFADPEGRYASPWKFVVGLTVGALCGWFAIVFTTVVGPMAGSGVNPVSAALSVLLTGLITWGLGVEEPSAFSTALLILVTDIEGVNANTPFVNVLVHAEEYVLSIFLSATFIALVFVAWRRTFYERRAKYLYETINGDDHVLVPMRGDGAETAAMFGAKLAAAHDAGKVVLLDVVADADDAVDGGEDASEDIDAATSDADSDDALPAQAGEAADRLEDAARRIRTKVGVPCEVVVASGDPVPTTVEAARDANCDLIVAPYEEEYGSLSEYLRGVFRSEFDTVAFRSATGRTAWKRILVTVARPGDSAHAMIDFASRLAGKTGSVSACTCIAKEMERRSAENRLADIVETASNPVETRVARADLADFLDANAAAYDLVFMGASRDRSAASRLVSPPTFERIHNVDCDVAIVDRGRL